MNRKVLISLLTGLFMSVFVSCESDSEILSDKEILSEALTKGNWQISLSHSLTQNTLDLSDSQLTFSGDGKVFALSQDESNDMGFIQNGSYALLYKEDEGRDPDEDLEYYYDSRNKRELLLSMVFSMNDFIIFNNRWKVKSYSSSSVVLQANDVILTLSKN